MVPLKYWALRVARRATPKPIVHWLLDRGIFIRPGADTLYPQHTVSEYVDELRRDKRTLSGSTVCVVGYGGSLGVGLYLLEAGAKRVILQDPFAPRRPRWDRQLDTDLLARFCSHDGVEWTPDSERIECFHGSLKELAAREPEACDYIFSCSVLEHVVDLNEIVESCASLVRRDGLNVHLVDLRDHLSGYPFEMLCYSETTWQKWLNPSTNLNRLRLGDYRSAWTARFPDSVVETSYSLPDEFAKAKNRIRSEFLTGRDEIDCAAQITIRAKLL